MTQHTGRMQNKVVLVTGAGSVGPGWGNGRAIAVRMVQEGAHVMALDLHNDRLEETLRLGKEAQATHQGEIASMTCNVTSAASIQTAVEATLKRFGRIDVLINNVGGSAAGGPVEMSEEVWDAQIDHNLKSVFMMCKNVLPHMLEQGAGNVVNIASTSGIRWTGSAQVAYAATKAAVIQMGRVMAVQYAKQGIRVNTVVPGQLHTPMVETRLAKQRAGGDVQTLLSQRQARIPLPFMGDGQDTANAVLFLSSDEARFITGTEIIVDGGMTVRCD
jgi:NAD(P)-dependent dehydrogenase (short-subunit alcohol dehydrogenase family)